ncbi:TPA: bifunctional methylenetetrahydrofolate dehydrogenase/methenyltetrahydrofolate cyclohydrolase FolD [Candidatus Woesearchaeota archaeon]|nr:bifunctional methylenetetrahydrofolate dehydrogenase/methenyltetrahydrofolate cyclohydrolase FolD [Candidatus Woesearchaeota archaeon]
MTATIIDGKKAAERIKARIKAEVAMLKAKPGLAAVLVGENPASKVYVDIKRKTCDEVGVYSELYKLPEETTEKELLHLIDKLNKSERIHAILVQLPLPKHISEENVLKEIAIDKDVDGFSMINVGRLASGEETAVPCTPKGVIRLLEENGIEVAGKNAVVIGRSNIVGKPVAMLLLNRNATVTVCHSKTRQLGEYTKGADILVVAVGKPKLVNGDMIKEGATVIDVGINRIDGKLVGDVDFESAMKKAAYLTPVPGGVGPMTVAMLIENTLERYKEIMGK